ncbi:MAG: hypothetical protein ABMA64_09220 [Myxococcota bacterium]
MRALVFGWLAVGCSGGGEGVGPDGADPGSDPVVDPPSPDPTGGDDPPTWVADVAPLLADRCGSCHRDGGIAPFSVATYDQAYPWAEAMLASVVDGSMPPFYAVSDEVCAPSLPWKDDLSLSPDEIALLSAWVAADAPEGDPADAVPAELRPVESLEDYTVELALQEPFTVPATGGDLYQCFRIPMPNTATMYMTGLEVVPGNDKVVHHVLVWNDRNDSSAGQAGADGSYGCSGFPDIFPTEMVGSWTPGVQPVISPDNTGTPIEVGASLVVNIHYHPTGTTSEVDQTKLRIRWTEVEPAMYTTWYMVDVPMGAIVQPGPNDQGGAEFRIPAGVPDHLETVQMWFTSLLFSADMTVFAITPHMHYLGTDMLVTIDHTDEPDECLIHTPGWKFDWQRDYVYDGGAGELPVIHPGDKVRVQCLYDNSTSNPYMAAHLAATGATEPYDTYWGEETKDEMCMAIVGLIVPKTGWSPLSW